MLPLCQTDTPTLQARRAELRRELAMVEYELAVRELPPVRQAPELPASSLEHR